MQVKLISLTQPLIDGIKTAEELIVHNARVSNPNNQLNVETGAKLIKYCIANKHWSIFEQASLCVEIKTSRAIAAQILRHKSFSFQELSQRYAQVSGVEQLEWRAQGKTNRQVGAENTALSEKSANLVSLAQDYCQSAYASLIADGVAKECARMVLPLNTTTTLYMNGNIRSWLTYLDTRLNKHTQKEHRDVAEQIKEVFTKQFPIISSAIDNFKNSYEGSSFNG